MTIKTCEEYVLNELNNEISKNERLTEDVEYLEQKNKELKKKNSKLMDLIKLFAKKFAVKFHNFLEIFFRKNCFA